MAGPIKIAGTFYNLARRSWNSRGAYSSLIEAAKSFRLRVSDTNLGRRFMRPRDISLGYRRLGGRSAVLRQTFPDIQVGQEIFEREEYSAVAAPSLPAPSTIVDLGGNIGLSSLYFDAIYPNARFVILEPDADNVRMIRQNLAHGIEAGRVHLVEAFVAGTDGEASIDRSGTALGYRKADEAKALTENDRIACVSMNTLIAQFNLDRIGILKCDIEGSERELFADCSSWIGRVDRLVVETHHPYTTDALWADLRKAGFHFEVLTVEHRDKFSVCTLVRKPTVDQ